MKPCPYRKTHEFDTDGLCKHCYAKFAEPQQTKLDFHGHTIEQICAFFGVSADRLPRATFNFLENRVEPIEDES